MLQSSDICSHTLMPHAMQARPQRVTWNTCSGAQSCYMGNNPIRMHVLLAVRAWTWVWNMSMLHPQVVDCVQHTWATAAVCCLV